MFNLPQRPDEIVSELAALEIMKATTPSARPKLRPSAKATRYASLTVVPLVMSPLLAGIPFVWTLCKIDAGAFIAMSLWLATYKDPRPVSGRKQLPWQTVFLWTWGIVAVLIPCFAIGGAVRWFELRAH